MQVNTILRSKGSAVYHISPESTVYKAIELMSKKGIGVLLVMKDDKLKGIISERDYRDKVILKGRRSKTTKVEEIMTPEVYSVSPDETVRECMTIMTEKKFRHLPVLDGDKVVGVISIGDLVKEIISKQKVEIDHLKNYIDGSYPR